MNPISNTSAHEQASLWAVRLEESNLTTSDHDELNAWLASDAAHPRLLATYCEFSTDVGHLLPVLVADGAVSIPAKGKVPSRSRKILSWGVLSAITAAALVAFVWVGRSEIHPETIATSSAQRRTFTPRQMEPRWSSTQTPAFRSNRAGSETSSAACQRGGLFRRQQGQGTPFHCRNPGWLCAGDRNDFQRSHLPKSSVLDVTVVEELRASQARSGVRRWPFLSARLASLAGDQLSARDGGVSLRVLAGSALDDALAWRQGRIVCLGMPLSELLARFGHYHGVRIYATPGAAALTVGGRFGLDDVEGFYGDIRVALPVRVTVRPDGSVRVSLSNEF